MSRTDEHARLPWIDEEIGREYVEPCPKCKGRPLLRYKTTARGGKRIVCTACDGKGTYYAYSQVLSLASRAAEHETFRNREYKVPFIPNSVPIKPTTPGKFVRDRKQPLGSMLNPIENVPCTQNYACKACKWAKDLPADGFIACVNSLSSNYSRELPLTYNRCADKVQMGTCGECVHATHSEEFSEEIVKCLSRRTFFNKWMTVASCCYDFCKDMPF